MKNDETSVSINLVNKEFQFKCPPAEIDKLQQAALYLDSKMQEIDQGQRAVNFEQNVVMAAMNISYELIHEQHKTRHNDSLIKRIRKLRERLAKAANQEQKIELIPEPNVAQ